MVEALHDAVVAAGLEAPVMVGHSIAAKFATDYAARHPTAAVVNVDQPLQLDRFAPFAQQLAPRLRGPDFQEAWAVLQGSMHAEKLDPEERKLVRAGDAVSQGLVLSYWAELLDTAVPDLVRGTDTLLQNVRAKGVPYLALFSDPIDESARSWLTDRLPAAEILVRPTGHHFPRISDADHFTALLTGLLAGLPVP